MAVALVLSGPLLAQAPPPGAEPLSPPRAAPPTGAGETGLPSDASMATTGGADWGAGLLVLASLALFDQPARAGIAELRGDWGDGLASFGRWYGDWHHTAPVLAGGALLAGAVLDGGRGARRASALIVGVLAGSLGNEALNRAVGRSRPAEGHGPWRFEPFDGHASFASGHTAYAFAIAGAVDEVTEGWIPVAPLYVAAAVTGVSRLYHDRHWLSDVAAGALIGVWIGRRSTALAMRTLGLSNGPAGAGAAQTGGWLARLEPLVAGHVLGVRVRL